MKNLGIVANLGVIGIAALLLAGCSIHKQENQEPDIKPYDQIDVHAWRSELMKRVPEATQMCNRSMTRQKSVLVSRLRRLPIPGAGKPAWTVNYPVRQSLTRLPLGFGCCA